MLNLFLSQTPRLVLEMKEAIDQHDLSRLSKIGHKLKSMISTLGISELKDDIRTLEKASTLNVSAARIEPVFQKVEKILAIVLRQLADEITDY